MTQDIEKHDTTRPARQSIAPGHPGAKPLWSSGAKSAVGTAISAQSRIWFTISSGTINEIYFPTIDQANTRSLRFLIAGDDFFSDEQNDADHTIRSIAPHVPGFSIASRCKKGFYELDKEVIADPERDTLLLSVRFRPAADHHNLRLYVFLDPHLGDSGAHNEAWTGQYKDTPMLFARREETVLALTTSAAFQTASCGFVGVSDGFTDIKSHRRMAWSYTEAQDGNVALTAEINWQDCGGEFIVAVGFGGGPGEAGQQARAGLVQDFDQIRTRYVNGWHAKQNTFLDLGGPKKNDLDLYRVSTAVLQTHESKRFPGAVIASLSIPWGFARGDKDIGGYHVLWPRDMIQAAMAKLACGDAESARATLFYLKCTQEKDGNWTQNMWLDGTPMWTATQMDGTSFSILLADALQRSGELSTANPWPMIHKSAEFLVKNGPVTQQDRWEENSGYSPYTMAVEVAALLAAADFFEIKTHKKTAEFLRETADAWNDAIDELTYVSGSDLARAHGVDGYYVRVTPPDVLHAGSVQDVSVQIKNLAGNYQFGASDIVSPDALGLVRFGLRSAGDPRIANTVRVIDATLKTQLSNGPVWHRYTHDGYGEQKNGQPFDNQGVGRGWPLLTGERAHYEIASGNPQNAEQLMQAIEAQTSPCGLIPEQVWDSDDIPGHQLYNGHPTGSGMPLVWAHAEYVKLLRSLREDRVWDTPPQTVERYQKQKKTSPFVIWTFLQQRTRIPRGKDLRLDVWAPAKVHWSPDEWHTVEETVTEDPHLGVHWARLNTGDLKPGTKVQFTFFWPGENRWENRNYELSVA